jgi:hypothetical protein
MFTLSSICLAGETIATEEIDRIVFIYNGHEYSSNMLEKPHDNQGIPRELRENAQPGDSIGYRRYKGTKIIEDISGSVTNDGQVIFPNGVGFSVKKTIFETLQRLKANLILLHSQNIGYIK